MSCIEKVNSGFRTIVFDILKERIKCVNEGHNCIGDVVDNELQNLVKLRTLLDTNDYYFVRERDFIARCVPIALDECQQPDIYFVKSATMETSKHQWIFKSLDNGLHLKDIEDSTRLGGGSSIYSIIAPYKSMMSLINTDNFGILHTGQVPLDIFFIYLFK